MTATCNDPAKGISTCPLCHATAGAAPNFTDPQGKAYALCPRCALLWMLPEHRLDRADEYAHYQTHQNDPADLRYRRFLGQLWEPLRARLEPGDHGLDYGSGPGPTLHLMASQDGFPCSAYDPFFDPHPHSLARTYAFITCSETAEHFFHPAREFRRLSELLHPGGWLGIMTLRLSKPAAFPDWHYRRDPTHVCFYQDQTFAWIASHFGFAPPIFPSNRVVLLQKPV